MINEPPLVPLSPARSGGVTYRSVAIGTLLVALICGITPYNDYVVANTMMVGIYLPVILVLLLFVLVVFINGPLHRFAPRWALGKGELGVILAMSLVACGIPGQGMMRSFIPTLVAPFHHGSQDPLFWKNFTAMNLPGWLFPVESVKDGRSSDVMNWFYDHLPAGAAAPYARWIIPLAGWGVFMLAMAGTFLALAAIVTPQWAVNERLAFPIAQLEQALIDPPAKGKMLNDLFRSRLFWIAVSGVVIIHSMATLHQYYPKYVPLIPIRYDLNTTFAEEPWIFFTGYLKAARIYFLFLGMAYFIPSRVSFSLWSSYLLVELVTVQQRMAQTEMPRPAWEEQHLGASVAFLLGVIWIGRQHWAKVLRQAVGRGADPKLPDYRISVLFAVCGPAVMFGWLMMVGVHAWVAVLIVAFVLLAHLVVARIVAETGLAFIRVLSSPLQVLTNLPTTSLRANDVFFTGVFQINGAHDTRESILAFATHGLRVNGSIDDSRKPQRGLLALMAWSLVLGFVVAAGSSLYCYYHYALPLGETNDGMINQVALRDWPRDLMAEPLNRWSDGHFPGKAYNSWLQMGIGVGVTGVLQAATLRWAWWPFLPVGYLVSTTWYVQLGWLSILLGWLCKLLIVQYGGAKLYQQARPFFFGLIFGEAFAAGLWALINLGLAMSGANYKVVQLLPY